ncbi:MAG: sigma-54 dependent transcriptional regulator [Pseudomonadales bacterium]|nr:sigma-54 dependent transcriptional regulator [Pseudomonadales bacterium]
MTTKFALIVDDEADIRELLEITLGRMDIHTTSAENIAAAKTLVAESNFDFCLTDMKLPDGSGIDLVQFISDQKPEMPVAMITAHGNMESAVEALKAGAFDFVSKPVNLVLLRNLVDKALNLKSIETSQIVTQQLFGNTEPVQLLRKQIRKLARSRAPVYISGESGTGKELVARLIHSQGPHANAPFIPVNCGAIPGDLMESEFFGHKKGSFTGATSDKEGLFQAANGGTLFLDEVADLPLDMQVKLLRGIQEKAIRPVGTQTEITVDVRILSATHKNLAQEVENNSFRQDLYYRINVIELNVPSLRDRVEDLPILIEELLRRITAEYQTEPLTLNPEAMAALTSYHFPGNIRELENILERAFTLCENDIITPADLNLATVTETEPLHTNQPQPVITTAINSTDSGIQTNAQDNLPDAVNLPGEVNSLESYLENIEKNAIVKALEATRWNKTAAAKSLGITFRALRYRLKKLNLD